MKRFFAITIIFISLISCSKSIYEDRSKCPCLLSLDLSQVRYADELYLWVFGSHNELYLKDTIPNILFDRDYELTLNGDIINYYVWANIGESTLLIENKSVDAILLKKENRQADSLYYSNRELDVRGMEFFRDTVRLYKEYIQLNVNVIGLNDPYFAELVGNSNGFTLDRRFIDGRGLITSDVQNESSFYLRMLRQRGLENINLLLYSADNRDKLLFSYPLGEWLNSVNYDMNAKNLDDIYLTIDLSANSFKIDIENWEDIFLKDIDN